MNIYDEILSWCKENNCMQVKTYYENIADSLSSYDTVISFQSDSFKEGYKFYIDNEKKLIWIYYGRNYSEAVAITINFDDDIATYSEYSIIDADDLPEFDTDEWWDTVNEWNDENWICEDLSIPLAIEKFNQYSKAEIIISSIK